MRWRACVAVCAAACASALPAPSSGVKLGVEFASRPWGTVDIFPQSYGVWQGLDGVDATIDAEGWPTEDAFAVMFDLTPWSGDPEQFIPPSYFGNYSLSFTGRADVTLGANISVSLYNVSFDAASWTTTCTVSLTRSATLVPVPGLAIGFLNSQRSASSPVGTGVSNVRLLQPGYSVWDPAVPFFTDAVLSALSPFTQVRLMEVLGTNGNYTLGSPMEWGTRRAFSDAMWETADYPRPGSLAAWPWEAVVLLGQALLGKPLWVNVHVAATGAVPGDTTSYVYNLATLLRDGSADTGGLGLPRGTILYVEHGNELWLNGTVGTADISYLYNLDAAQREVAGGGSVLNNDGETDPRVWAQRRHLKRLREIHAVLASILTPDTGITLRIVLSSFQDYHADVDACLRWYASTYGTSPGALFYGLAINSYYIAYTQDGWSGGDMSAALLSASDALGSSRRACASLISTYGMTALMSYEGMATLIPADGNGDAGAWEAILDFTRSALVAPPIKYDVEVGWLRTPGAGEYNLYALSSWYGPFPLLTWGLTEDVSNTSTPKYGAAMQVLGLE